MIERLLWHLGFRDVRNIDGSGDGGGDLLGILGSELFCIQNKWTSRGTISRDGVDEVERAKAKYSADRAVLVTNAVAGASAYRRQKALASVGIRIEMWNGEHLARMFSEIPERIPMPFSLRPYQSEAVAAMQRDLDARRRALLILATGLGKTIIGGEVIAHFLAKNPGSDVLVVAHMRDLVQQLEKALWRHIPKYVNTNALTGEHKPSDLSGVVCATIESALGAVYDGYRPGLVMVDETHHVGESGQFQRLLDLLTDAQQFGVTATPWRGDQYDITRRFGAVSFKMGIADGMAGGFLSQVDYRLYVDDIDWNVVKDASSHGYTVRELNKKLFLPQRDEAIVDFLLEAWREVREPRAVIFCQTIEHAERVAELLARSSPNWRRAACISSKQGRRDRDVLMAQFRLGRVPIVATVDVFNEGVDVPDVNIICFLRVTHSRRIFVQQLGRGLRVREGKESVVVLDFVSDIRRVAATLDLKRNLQRLYGDTETLELSRPSRITFSDDKVGSLMDAWIQDAADLETAADEAKLEFPLLPGSIS